VNWARIQQNFQTASGHFVVFLNFVKVNASEDCRIPSVIYFVQNSEICFSAIGRRETLEPSGDESVLPRIRHAEAEAVVDGLIYLIGLIVVIMAILSFFGLR